MKRSFLCVLVLAALLLCGSAFCEEAKDLTDQCRISSSGSKYKVSQLYDRNYRTNYIIDKSSRANLVVEAPGGKPAYGVYVCFGDALFPWKLEVMEKNVWTTVYESPGLYAHEYVPLDGAAKFRLIANNGKKSVTMAITELFVFGEGDVPAFVQRWEPAPEKADLMVLAAHPDDEVLFFGGVLPTYAGQMQKRVVVAYATCGTAQRRSELLNGLWEMGVRTYPVIGDFYDKYSTKPDKGYEIWGKKKFNAFLVELLRKYQPDVVVTHDVNGEYGHGAHRVCADAMKNCVAYAADPEAFADSAVYGAWQVKKLYLHLYGENAIEMDWDQPLPAFGGKTAYEVALDGYNWHVSQHEAGQKNPATGKFEYFTVEPRDSANTCYRFGLCFSAVGADVNGGDLFENIP